MKLKKVTIFVFIVIVVVIILLSKFYNAKRSISFKESNEKISNPARGFYTQINSSEKERFEELKKENIKVALVAYNLKDYLDKPIDEEKLEELKLCLEAARKNEVNIIFRAAYSFSEIYEDPKSLDLIATHIEQVSEIINSYKDVILCVQAGFLGPWGEWHGSKFLSGNEEEKTLVRNTILEDLLNCLDEEIIVNVRRPKFIRSAIEAGLKGERLGIHNDAFLATEDDMGTYDDPNFSRKEELLWVNENVSTGINGGETPSLSDYTNIDNAVKEMKMLKFNYLNSKYNKEVLENWKTSSYKGENAYDYVDNHLGYRLWIKNIEVPLKLNHLFNKSLKVKISNSGFAAISEKYKMYIVLNNGEKLFINEVKNVNLNFISSDESKDIAIDINLNNDKFKAINGEILKIGIYIGDNEKKSQVKLANEELEFYEGINYFAEYKLKGNTYILKEY